MDLNFAANINTAVVGVLVNRTDCFFVVSLVSEYKLQCQDQVA